MRVPVILAALALGIATAELSACGGSGSTSGAVSSVAKEATKTISSAASQVTSQTQTTPAKSQTVTKTAGQPTVTTTAAQATTTKTAAQTATTTPVTHSTSVKVDATQTAPASPGSSGGLPWWGWVLIGIGVVASALAIFALGRRHAKASTTGAPPAADTYRSPPPAGDGAPPPAPRPPTGTPGGAPR